MFWEKTENPSVKFFTLPGLKVKHHFCKFHVKQALNKKLKDYFDIKNIPSTNNKIENIFQKIFSRHIKGTMKIGLGLLG